MVKNCEHCYFYVLNQCVKHDIPVSNVNSCDVWMPKISIISVADYGDLKEYTQYLLTVNDVEIIRNRRKLNE